MGRGGRGRGRLLVGAALTVVVALTAAGPVQPGGPPRVQRYPPRVSTYTPRVVGYQPRVVSEVPKQTTPTAVTVGSDILFAFDSAALSGPAQTVLGALVARLKAGPAGQVVVTGYTDSIGDPTFNLTLSQQRAQAVQQLLAAQVARPDVTYQVVGAGEADPVAPNTNPDGSDDPTGRALNRRVVLTVPG